MKWSMLLLLATPFKTVTNLLNADACEILLFGQHCCYQAQVTVKFMPVHIPTPEEKADPILFAQVMFSPIY